MAKANGIYKKSIKISFTYILDTCEHVIEMTRDRKEKTSRKRFTQIPWIHCYH